MRHPADARFRRAALALLVATALTPVTAGQGRAATGGQPYGHGPGLERLGTVELEVTCNDEAQAAFNHAMALYHSFAWPAAKAAFERVAETDPACGMAHWGRAMVILDNPFTWPANLAPKLPDVAAALEAARATGLGSERERDYVEALAVFVQDHETVDHRTRLQALDEAMAALAARYPDDLEASILSALITSANFDPTDKEYKNQMRAAAILEPIFESHPDHPGVAHYLIHTYDYPPIAQHGLEAARRYAGIAPDAPHALHMPAHIFTRLGYWQESIAANEASAKAAAETAFDPHHAYDYMVYAKLQLGRDKAAQETLAGSSAMPPVDHFAAAYAYAAMPARLALERSDWQAAKDLQLAPAADAYPWQKYPQAEAVNAFARGIGAARAGEAEAARVQQGRLLALRDAAAAAGLGYWAGQIDIQAAVVAGLALCAEGQQDACIAALREAAAREDATEKHVVTPGPLLPAREILADILLEAGQGEEALLAYEAVLAKEPNRARAILGAARAAALAGDDAKARAHYGQLIELAADADPGHAWLDEARAFVERG